MGGIRRDPETAEWKMRSSERLMRNYGGIRNAGDHAAAGKLLMVLLRSGFLLYCY